MGAQAHVGEGQVGVEGTRGEVGVDADGCGCGCDCGGCDVWRRDADRAKLRVCGEKMGGCGGGRRRRRRDIVKSRGRAASVWDQEGYVGLCGREHLLFG